MSMTYTKAQFAEKHKEAISLFQAGLGYRAVATALLLNPYTVRDWARNWRFQIRANAPGTPEDRQKAFAMRAKGASLMEIAAEIKCSKRTIRKVEVDFSNESQSVCRARIEQGQSVDLSGIGKVSAIPSAEDQYDYVGYFKLDAGDIVTTSSDKERHIDIKGKRYGHIMSGRTGRPAENTFAYVTVIDHDGARGDTLSTALWVLGDKAFDFLKAHPDIQALLVMKNENAAYVTPSLADRTYVKSERLKLKEIE